MQNMPGGGINMQNMPGGGINMQNMPGGGINMQNMPGGGINNGAEHISQPDVLYHSHLPSNTLVLPHPPPCSPP